jgi:hypothetical protein
MCMTELATNRMTADSTMGSQRAESGTMRSLLIRLTTGRRREAILAPGRGQAFSRARA